MVKFAFVTHHPRDNSMTSSNEHIDRTEREREKELDITADTRDFLAFTSR